ncbi:MAG TPA: 3-phosphoshikimate 1-carboxyvinyltransferase [Thermoplasmata archaeon]|nr:3-phosphoshikimate 1-carboxyvinyltransferase [Thermoplasmata archaeon]
MTVARVSPGPLSGRIRPPGSKSYTHRALVLGFFAGRPFEIRDPLVSDDTRATRVGLDRLGAHTARSGARWRIAPSEGAGRALGRTRVVDCGESGTTLRFLSAVAATRTFPVRLVGRPGLARRPIGALATSLRAAGARVEPAPGRSLPLLLRGPIHAGRFAVDASESSQYASALLLALPSLDGRSSLRLTGTTVSAAYIDATLAILRAHGIRVRGGPRAWTVEGPARPVGRSFTVPGDASSAAYLWAGAAVTGGEVTVDHVPSAWPQADRRILGILASAGATVRDSASGATVRGPLSGGFDVDLTSAPDLYPLVGALAATRPERSILRGARHVVLKESDRRTATIELVRALGGRARSTRAGLEIRGTRGRRAPTLPPSTDHRVVMSGAIAALAGDGPVRVGDAGCVAKSFPGFWSALASLGTEVTVR